MHCSLSPSRSMPAAAAFALLAHAGASNAAGGHFDVDDANILDPGHCQLELWASRQAAAALDGQHAGPSCRLGPVEIGIDLDRVTVGGDRSTALGPHLKWATTLVPDRLSVGAVIGTAFDVRRGSDPVTAYYVPLTWVVTPRWTVNAMAGQDRGSEGTTPHLGASVEWSPAARWTVIAEHARIGGGRVERLGGRWSFAARSSLDLSAARNRANPGALWTLGFNHDLER